MSGGSAFGRVCSEKEDEVWEQDGKVDVVFPVTGGVTGVSDVVL